MPKAEVVVNIVAVMEVWLVLYSDGGVESIWFTARMANERRDELTAGGGEWRVKKDTVQMR